MQTNATIAKHVDVRCAKTVDMFLRYPLGGGKMVSDLSSAAVSIK